jgi:hypothetical protein
MRTTPEARAKDATYQKNKRKEQARRLKRTGEKNGRPCKINDSEAIQLLNRIKEDLLIGIVHHVQWFIDEVCIFGLLFFMLL